MKQYMMSVFGAETDEAPSPEVMQQMYADVDVFNKKLQAQGAWVFGGGLFPASSATVVDNSTGDATVTDGPYVETKEQLGGFWIIKAPDLDSAIALAKEGSAACRGAVEVRPFQDEPEV